MQSLIKSPDGLLAKLLRDEPSEEVIDAVSSVANEECVVQLGRIARTQPALCDAALNALEGSDHPRADTIATAIHKALPPCAKAGAIG